MLIFRVKVMQTDRRTDRQTTVKQYVPDLSIQGHKKKLVTCIFSFFTKCFQCDFSSA